jgi:hypothetical protein
VTTSLPSARTVFLDAGVLLQNARDATRQAAIGPEALDESPP